MASTAPNDDLRVKRGKRTTSMVQGTHDEVAKNYAGFGKRSPRINRAGNSLLPPATPVPCRCRCTVVRLPGVPILSISPLQAPRSYGLGASGSVRSTIRFSAIQRTTPPPKYIAINLPRGTPGANLEIPAEIVENEDHENPSDDRRDEGRREGR
jgi:hypothetical protein